MSGLLAYNFREGNRSEYLANYLLSGLGLVTAVPRQEDIGFDFYCQLADQESGNLTFSFPFVIQIKSKGKEASKIVYGNPDVNKWNQGNIEWLSRLEIPFFIGILCKDTMQLDIYSTSLLYITFMHSPLPSIIELYPRLKRDGSRIKKPEKELLKDWDSSKGDGYRHKVDLGNPVVTFTNADLREETILKDRKDTLRNCIFRDQQNKLFQKLNIPFSFWMPEIKTNEFFNQQTHYGIPPNYLLASLHEGALAEAIITIAINYYRCGRIEEALELKPILKRIRNVFPGIKQEFPDLFD